MQKQAILTLGVIGAGAGAALNKDDPGRGAMFGGLGGALLQSVLQRTFIPTTASAVAGGLLGSKFFPDSPETGALAGSVLGGVIGHNLFAKSFKDIFKKSPSSPRPYAYLMLPLLGLGLGYLLFGRNSSKSQNLPQYLPHGPMVQQPIPYPIPYPIPTHR